MTENPPNAGRTTKNLTIKRFVESVPDELDIEVIAGSSGVEVRHINSERIQKLGLALSGYTDYIHLGRVQMIGKSELSYLNSLPPDERSTALRRLTPENISCILITKALEPPPELVTICDETGIPLLRTAVVSSKAIGAITEFLNEALAAEATIHGVLLEMFGLGVLLLGESGIGKSECALDLISRHHRLVADDSIKIKRVGQRLEGASPPLTFEHLEIRGLGIINVRQIFGVSSICKSIRVELCIELKKWNDGDSHERIGFSAGVEKKEILGVPVPRFTLPVRPGRNLAILFETAVKLFLLRNEGYDAARELVARHDAIVGGPSRLN
ncbi:MAG TPA: HPr(Ser) kinase/phosphatase [Pyrinomonadaceae bacterium]|nr:HPr(Ser) kinase/phosphatase [Pyrinomonadaceae bacterium]